MKSESKLNFDGTGRRNCRECDYEPMDCVWAGVCFARNQRFYPLSKQDAINELRLIRQQYWRDPIASVLLEPIEALRMAIIALEKCDDNFLT